MKNIFMNLLRVSFILFILGVLFGSGVKARKESIRLLKAAQTTNELANAVKLGIFLSFPDDSWMAIRYVDSHAAIVGFSSAVVRDSGGSWFSSSHHFCGRFRILSNLMQLKKMNEGVEELNAHNDSSTSNYFSGVEDLHQLATAPDLNSARKFLVKLQFRELNL